MLRSAFCGAVAVALLHSSASLAAGWIAFPERTETVTVEGQSASVAIRPEISLAPRTDGATDLAIRAEASLDDLSAKSAAMLAALAARHSRCEMRWSFPTLGRPEVVGDGLSIAGQVRLEVRICGFGEHKLGTETADFTLTLRPVHSESDVGLAASLDRLDLGRSLIGGSAESELRRFLEGKLNGALGTKARLGFPAEVLALKPKIETVELRRGAGDSVILFAAANGVVDTAGLEAVMRLLAKKK